MGTETPAVYIGVDVGSTTTKAIAFGENGEALAVGSQGYAISRPRPGWAVQDAREWFDAVDASVAALAETVDLGTVRSIGITSQVDTHIFVDEALEPVTEAFSWQDVRCAAEVDAVNERLGEAGRIAEWGAPDPLDASNPVPRALWLAANDPAAWARTRWVLFPKDYVNARLTGSVATDPFASFKTATPVPDYVTGVAGAPGLPERLAPLQWPEEVVGRTLADWHGVPAGIPMATGSMDGMGNTLGSGLREPGDAMVILGTSVIGGSVGIGGTSGPGVANFAPYRGRQVHAGPTQSGGDSLRWWAGISGRSIDDVIAAAADSPPGANGVMFAPHLLGERAPLWDADVRGWFLGLSAGSGFADLSRAVLEGIACSARELMDAVDVAASVPSTVATLSGGGSQSPLWCQIVADVTGREMRRSVEKDTAVVGAAVFAAAVDTGADPWDASRRLVVHDAVFEPSADNSACYEELYALYRQSYAALREVHARMRPE